MLILPSHSPRPPGFNIIPSSWVRVLFCFLKIRYLYLLLLPEQYNIVRGEHGQKTAYTYISAIISMQRPLFASVYS